MGTRGNHERHCGSSPGCDQRGRAWATVTIANRETGLKRSAKTDDAGRFNFPQLKPGTYSVKVEAQGFEPQQNDNVVSGLGQKQTVDFTLRVAQSNADG